MPETITVTQRFSPSSENAASAQNFISFSHPTSTSAASIFASGQRHRKHSLIESRKVAESRKYGGENGVPLPAIARPRTLYGLHRNTSSTYSSMNLTPTDPGSISPAYIAGFRAAIYAAFNMATAAEGQSSIILPTPPPTTSFNINSMSDESPSSSANTTPSSEFGPPCYPWPRFTQQPNRRKSHEDGRPGPFLIGSPTTSAAPVVNDLQYQLFLDQVRNVERTLRNAHY